MGEFGERTTYAKFYGLIKTVLNENGVIEALKAMSAVLIKDWGFAMMIGSVPWIIFGGWGAYTWTLWYIRRRQRTLAQRLANRQKKLEKKIETTQKRFERKVEKAEHKMEIKQLKFENKQKKLEEKLEKTIAAQEEVFWINCRTMFNDKNDSLFFRKYPVPFFTRKNGVSTGDFASLNCSVKVGDDPAKVRENMRRVAGNLGCTVEKLFVLHQTHSSIAVPVTTREPFEKTPYGDALVTNRSNIFLGIKTADCAPVLLADAQNGVVAAAHAGWRGAVGGILENTVRAMVEMGAETDNISALIGPCIAPQSYEVGEDMKESFCRQMQRLLCFCSRRSGKIQI